MSGRWGTVRVSVICINSVICKLDLEVWASSLQRRLKERGRMNHPLQVSVFSDYAECLGKLARRSCFLTRSQLTWIPPAVTTCGEVWLNSLKWNHWELLSWRRGGRKFSRALHAVLAVGLSFFLLLCYFHPFSLRNMRQYFYKQRSIKPHKCDSSLETRLLPTWILFGRGRNSMS